MRAFLCLAGAITLFAATSDAGAQFPGELRGDVVDVLSGRAVPTAEVRLANGVVVAITDAAGSFRVRGLEPGSTTLTVQAAGYARLSRPVEIRNGTVATIRLEMVPDVMELPGLVAEVGGGTTGLRSLTGAELRAVPATSVGALLETVPGVRVESRGRGGSQVPSIRGSSGDAVLVLVDGVPINDPVTGEADLSTVPVSTVAALHVLPGGRSARYGARAEGGVILIETGRTVDVGLAVTGLVGSLGERGVDGSFERALAQGTLAAGAGMRRLAGRFDFEIPEEAGGGSSTRENAGVDGAHARLAWTRSGGRTELQVTASGERLRRGLPGRSFAPSRTAGQELARARASASLDFSTRGPWTGGTRAWLSVQRMEHRDSAPPFGDPFDAAANLFGSGVEARATRGLGSASRVTLGLEATRLRVRSTQFQDPTGALARTDAGAWLSLTHEGPGGTLASGSLRADRSGLPSAWFVSHAVALGWTGGAVSARVGHRSSFSPPTLADQFFRDGVGVEPNPELAAERVPSEWVAALTVDRPVRGAVVSAEVEAYRGDIQGMIVWLPDFRFVWSPRNLDVRRRGVEVAVRVRSPVDGWRAGAHVSWNRTTYDRPGLEDVQVVYRPAVDAGVSAGWSEPGWRVSVVTGFTGARYPVPNAVNELPGFWITDVEVARRWTVSSGSLEVATAIERLFDHDDSLIFAFPDPGRTARVTVRWSR